MDTAKPELDEDNTYAKEALLCEIGVKLQHAREIKGFSQEHVVKELKFSVSFLQALESGNWEEMPGEIYALGFLRQYAELLELDVTKDIERIKTNSYELTTPLTYPDAPISPNRTWVVIAVLLFILVIIITNLLSFSGETNTEVAVVGTTQQAQSEAVKPDAMEPTTPLEVEQAQQEPAVKPLQIQKEPSVSQNKVTAPVLTATPDRTYTFIAVSDDVWLQVFQEIEGDEPKLRREALLRVGQSFSLDSSSRLLITSGKPIALEVLLNDEVIFEQGNLGEEGKVLKMFPLESN